MARDSQAALVALNRFGFGARGGAYGDFINAASDPRGFVKAELARPSGVLLEVPHLQSTPALARAIFEYQDQLKQAREAAPKSPPPSAGAASPNAGLGRSRPIAPSASFVSGFIAPASLLSCGSHQGANSRRASCSRSKARIQRRVGPL